MALLVSMLVALIFMIIYGVVFLHFEGPDSSLLVCDSEFFHLCGMYNLAIITLISIVVPGLLCSPEDYGYRFLEEREIVSAGVQALASGGIFVVLGLVNFGVPIEMSRIEKWQKYVRITPFVFTMILTLFAGILISIMRLSPGTLGYEKISEENIVTERSISESEGHGLE